MPILPLAPATPIPIVTPIAVTITTSALEPVTVEIAVATVAPETVCKARAWSATVPTPVTCVMAVNEFRTLFVPVRDSATASLGVRVS